MHIHPPQRVKTLISNEEQQVSAFEHVTNKDTTSLYTYNYETLNPCWERANWNTKKYVIPDIKSENMNLQNMYKKCSSCHFANQTSL